MSGAPTKFYDVQFTSNSAIQSALNLNALFNEITHAISRSEKAPRFFTPILVNLARHLHPPKFIEFVEIIHTDEEVYTLVKKVLPEGEFIVFTIIDRFFEDLDKDEQTFAHQLTGIIESWTGGGRGWLIERLNKTNKHGPVPDQIIRPEHRGRWRALAIKDPAKPAK
ncbi:MAG: hypothetical protein B7Z37_16650 [Verrucomicrobia bacterium 12-59-8]|nr:MAG: hypothetical protein B7Z37_16650 [Verrucomicrobia bacterium 12-59-8]